MPELLTFHAPPPGCGNAKPGHVLEGGSWKFGVTSMARNPNPNPLKCARSSGQTLDIESIISSNFQK